MKKIIVWAMATLCFVTLAIPASAVITQTTAEVNCTEVNSYTDGSLIPTGVDVGYIFMWGTVPGNYSEYHDAGWDQLNYGMTNLVPGTTYYISARAYTSLNEESGDAPEHVYLHIGAPRLPVYRFVNITNWSYMFTVNEAEKNYYISSMSGTWKFEGIKFYAYLTQAWGTVPVYRFLNIKNWTYMFTVSEAEKNNVIAKLSGTWKYEGVKFYAHASQLHATVPVYRFLNIKNWTYLYTASESEKNNIISTLSKTWKYEGVKFYVGATQAQ